MSKAELRCPHCGSKTVVRTSRLLSRTVRESTYVCTNEACGASFIGLTNLERELSPSAMPRADVNLPRASTDEIMQRTLEHLRVEGGAQGDPDTLDLPFVTARAGNAS